MATRQSGYAGTRRRASLLAIVVVNLIPLVGVLGFGWDVAALMILYWSENLVLGFYTLVKMLIVSPLGGSFSGLFFLIHYGGFCGVHGMFIMLTLVDGEFSPFPDDTWPLFLVFPQILFNVTRAVLDYAPAEWIVAFAALFASHGVSFLANFLFGPERNTTTVGELMGGPYGRIVVLHIAIIAGGFAVMALGQPLFMLIVLIALKMAMDLGLHLREHGRKAA
ncbi:DUF6498-containing protein [Seongchinamella sediminis]|uniref:DUF6498-containing protein n=1 Tax=Seongchinamella sediminis TaxID=2283635 RepID=UPI0010585FCD|nr:DUF6498-containing protein [Seongchinamella sediminis]